MATLQAIRDLANILRRDSILATTEAGSGHPTSCLSCAELLATLFFSEMKYDIRDAKNPNNDEFILSKGHAAPILYSALFRAGCIKDNLQGLRKLDSDLEGHPIPHNPWIKVSSGSLGQGLSAGVGMALSAHLSKRSFRTFVLMGDSESAEGSIYEAAQLASHYKLSNLVAILDINRLGQTGQTMLGHNIKQYEARWKSFGWHTITINGHDIKEIQKSLSAAKSSDKPTIILAKTIKGKGVSFLEDKEGWHGKALDEQQAAKALHELPRPKIPRLPIKKPSKSNYKITKGSPRQPSYKVTDLIATRTAYGNALAKLAETNSNAIAIDAEVSNSTHAELVQNSTPHQFIEAFIAEQNLIGMAQGLSIKGFSPYASTFSAFLTRAHDQLRMAAIGKASFTVSGSHAGVSIGEDGPSQMALEDISLFRSLPGSTVLYPSDAVSTEKLLFATKDLPGIKFIRTSRPKTPLIYQASEEFPIGEFKILQESPRDKVTIATAGICTHEALKAYITLKQQNIPAAILDIYSIKPFNEQAFRDFVKAHGSKLIIAEDHYKSGGLGEMLSSALSGTGIPISHLHIKEIPHSGTKEQLLEKYEIDAKAIIHASNMILVEGPELEQDLSIQEEKPKKKVKKVKKKTKKRK